QHIRLILLQFTCALANDPLRALMGTPLASARTKRRAKTETVLRALVQCVSEDARRASRA
ncbi:MAG: hypothetical protein ACRD72_05845, partial [Candidatus Angelobacter sp.]